MNSIHKFTSLGIILLFVIAIFTPLIGGIVQEDTTVSHAEKRPLNQFPGFPAGREALVSFPRDFENYYNDQFGLRELFITMFSGIKELIGDTEIASAEGIPTENTIRGKDGWFFLNRVWDGDPVSDYRNISLYSETDLLRATLLFAARNDWLRRKGIKYLLFFAPNKHTIYSEYMPDYIVKQGDISSMDQLYDSLAKYTSVEFVDLRETLLSGKKEAHRYWKDRKEEAALYYKTDSHWNGAGADLVQYEVAKRLERLFPGLITPAKRPPEDFVMTSATGDISLIMGRDDEAAYGPTVFNGKCSPATAEEFQQRQQVTTCATGRLNALIFHDSFYTLPLKAFFADYFARTVFLWEPMSQAAVIRQLKEGGIDVVIEQRAERFLPYTPHIGPERYNPFWRKLSSHWKKVVFTMDFKRTAKNSLPSSSQGLRLHHDKGGDSLDIHATGADPHLTIAGIPFRKDTLYMLHVEIESEKRAKLDVFFSSLDPTVPFPDKGHMFTYTLREGSNTLYIPLFTGNLGDRLRIVPGTGTGLYRLKQFEIMEVDSSSLHHLN